MSAHSSPYCQAFGKHDESVPCYVERCGSRCSSLTPLEVAGMVQPFALPDGERRAAMYCRRCGAVYLVIPRAQR